MTATALDVSYSRTADHRYTITVGDQSFVATVHENLTPGNHWVNCGDHGKDFTDLGEALVWAKTRVTEAAEAARTETPNDD